MVWICLNLNLLFAKCLVISRLILWIKFCCSTMWLPQLNFLHKSRIQTIHPWWWYFKAFISWMQSMSIFVTHKPHHTIKGGMQLPSFFIQIVLLKRKTITSIFLHRELVSFMENKDLSFCSKMFLMCRTLALKVMFFLFSSLST